MTQPKRLVKSQSRVICGVCGGLSEYLNLDPVIMRILWILFAILGGSGILVYLIFALVMPNK
ncbi:MAG: PspC domain-containing protein [Salinivirgaceae bacterium]|nr:PspC domain-containing protein [Salinivirgaceae bacterium]